MLNRPSDPTDQPAGRIPHYAHVVVESLAGGQPLDQCAVKADDSSGRRCAKHGYDRAVRAERRRSHASDRERITFDERVLAALEGLREVVTGVATRVAVTTDKPGV